jgi:hypothetical protein
MNEKQKKDLQFYVDYISKATGKSFHVKFDGLLATVLHDGQIVFTCAGLQNVTLVEAFVGGFANGLAKGLNYYRS